MDMYTDVLFAVYHEKCCPTRYLKAVCMEYIKTLALCGIPLQAYMIRFLIDILIYAVPPDYTTLHQYLQYHVIEDHIPIALQLLQFKAQYPPAFQLALDMLSRLKAYPEIVEVFVAHDMPMRAAQVMLQYRVQSVPLHHIFEKAVAVGDNELFYSVYQLLQKFNSECRGLKDFCESDKCQHYTARFAALFGSADSAPRDAQDTGALETMLQDTL
jgi:hypothetical protein